MTDFLLELRSEEIPARMQAKAREDLARLFAAELAKAGIAATEIVTYATPRRLALIARDLPDATAAVSEEVKGPRTSAPPQALDGFLRKTGLTADQLTERDGVWFAVTNKPGRATADVLADAIPAIVRAFPWPKSMRWGDASAATDSLRWVRPLHGIVAIFGEDLVPVEIAGITSQYATLGHRFHHPGPITLGGAHDYVEKLRACHVIVDQAEREELIRTRATALATDAGLELVADEGLVAENAGLTEWPVPLLGRFEPEFLDVPAEVIQLTARVNQKYFVCRDAGKLANAFVCTANIDAADGGARIVEGNRKVLAARLSDARFFYDQDLKVPLEEQATKLDRIVFHEKLGTVADKVDRVAKLARWLVEESIVKSSPRSGEGDRSAQPNGGGGVPHAAPSPESPLHHQPAAGGSPPLPGEDQEELAALADRAARLCKADLVTGMVAEFPELQGVMGGYYAAAQGEDPRVAAAIRDHYKPVGQGDDVPTEPVTVAVSLADKLDTLVGFFANEIIPTGSRDPYALRRSALGIMALILQNQIRIELDEFMTDLVSNFFQPLPDPSRQTDATFIIDWDELRADPNILVQTETGRTTVTRAGMFLFAFAGEFGKLEDLEARIDGVWDGFEALLAFIIERMRVYLRGLGFSHDLIAASAKGQLPGIAREGFKSEDFDLVRLLARVCALQAFVGTEDGANLLTGYRRAANILKKEGYGAPANAGAQSDQAPRAHPGLLLPQEHGTPEKTLSYTPEPAESALHAALDSAEPAAADAVAAEDFGAAMAALASLRAPIDRFFEAVTVNDPDAAKRAARLQLLARVRDAVHTVADFSKIEG